ncbi:MAG: DUF4231 domain-containing protein [Burkholderiales bacterium]|nr:DUF4231 domain-containing protein [Burkholderiales bacterium]MDR4518885.1 DUF4231 domain-containing protein [Nitrosomonas sp.]
MTMTSVLPALTTERQQRADEYFQVHLNGQREWYSKKATSYKKWGQILSVVVIGSGALVSVVQLVPVDTDVGARVIAMLTAFLGLIITLAKGIDRIGKFEESWVSYRKASESMKREYRLYINNAGSYAEMDNEEQAYRRFVEQTEQIIAEEQQLFWQHRDAANNEQKLPAKTVAE